MKKMFPDEKGNKRGFRDFFDKKGFYIVLLLCIAVVAGTAVFVTTRNATSGQLDDQARNMTYDNDQNAQEKTADAAADANVLKPEGTQASAVPQKQTDIGDPAAVDDKQGGQAVQTDDQSVKKDDTKTPAAPSKDTAPKTTTPKTTTPKTKTTSANSTAVVQQQSFILPVIGQITVGFAKDKLVYSKTLEEWRAHTGVDIAADRGTPVKAAADGIVVDVRNDPYMGITVSIEHSKGLQTVYRNLASDESVAVNQKIKQGEIIGSIGNTAADESSEQAHLHFEVIKDNVSVDPMAYLPKSAADKME